MRRYTNLWILLAIGLFGVPFVTLAEASADETLSLARGARLYSANCGRCHNPRGAVEFTDGQWPLIMTHMRVMAGLPGDQAREIEFFLRASNNPPARVASLRTPPQGLSGEQLVQQYGCSGCHKIGGSGGIVGPSLDGIFERRGETWVWTQIQRPRENNPKTVMPDFGFTDDQVAAIVEVLRAAQ